MWRNAKMEESCNYKNNRHLNRVFFQISKYWLIQVTTFCGKLKQLLLKTDESKGNCFMWICSCISAFVSILNSFEKMYEIYSLISIFYSYVHVNERIIANESLECLREKNRLYWLKACWKSQSEILLEKMLPHAVDTFDQLCWFDKSIVVNHLNFWCHRSLQCRFFFWISEFKIVQCWIDWLFSSMKIRTIQKLLSLNPSLACYILISSNSFLRMSFFKELPLRVLVISIRVV